MTSIDIRIELKDDSSIPTKEDMLLREIVGNHPAWVESAVILRNNGFAHLMPDESTRVPVSARAMKGAPL